MPKKSRDTRERHSRRRGSREDPKEEVAVFDMDGDEYLIHPTASDELACERMYERELFGDSLDVVQAYAA